MTDEGNITDAAALIAQAMDCNAWPKWLHDAVDFVTANDGEMSTEQAVALGILASRVRPAGEPDEVEQFVAAVKLLTDAGWIVTDPRKAPAGEPVAYVHRNAISGLQAGGVTATVVSPAHFAIDSTNLVPLYASLAPSYADAIRDAAAMARNHPRSIVNRGDGSADVFRATQEEIASAIEALTPRAPL